MFPDRWRTILGLDRASGTSLGQATNRSLADPDSLVAFVIDYWDQAFRPLFDGDHAMAGWAKVFATDIRRLRGRWAHQPGPRTVGSSGARWRTLAPSRQGCDGLTWRVIGNLRND